MESASSRHATEAELLFVGPSELKRIRELDCDPTERAAAFADACRLNTLSMIAEAGSGHVGTSFSSMDILAWLHLEVLEEPDRYFSSKGHDAPALYATLAGLGRIDFDLLHRLRRLGGLPGHPDVRTTPQVITNTGSLGMGVSKAKGFVLADRAAGRSGRVFVLTGDGELQEGQFWESLPAAANRGLGEITVIVDHNKLQSDTWVASVSDLGALPERVASCGWAVARCDGHDLGVLSQTLDSLLEDNPERPKLLVADTVKGKGVSFMEPRDLPAAGDSLYPYHSGAPSTDEYDRAAAEILERLEQRLRGAGATPPRTDPVVRRPGAPAAARPQRIVEAYGRALADLAAEEPALVALDADLYLDTGLIPFRERFPDRFYECGIAEQDMVSQAGAMALAGLLPAVHSFGCFLATRPNEQIYNNATEGTRIIYAGSLVGIVPGGPGHSHQSVRDISALGAMPGHGADRARQRARGAARRGVGRPGGPRARLHPARVRAVGPRLRAPARGAAGAGSRRGGHRGRRRHDRHHRPGDALPGAPGRPAARGGGPPGRGRVAALAAPRRRRLAGRGGRRGPGLLRGQPLLEGGQGDAVLAALAAAGASNRVHKLGVESVPECGTNDEVLGAHRLDAAQPAPARGRRVAMNATTAARVRSVVCWDIDGTLLTTARAGVFALEEAAREVLGAVPDFAALPTAGLTDAEVAALAIRTCGGMTAPTRSRRSCGRTSATCRIGCPGARATCSRASSRSWTPSPRARTWRASC